MNKNELLEAIDKAYEIKDKLRFLIDQHEEIILLADGANNTIAQRVAIDFTRYLNKKAYSLDSIARINSYTNIYGGTRSHAQFVKEFAIPRKTLIILLSNCGNSKNILNAANRCEVSKISWAGLSGGEQSNKLHTKNYRYRKLNFWANSADNRVIETAHKILLFLAVGVK